MSVGDPTQSWEAIGSKTLLIDEGTNANKPLLDLMPMEEETADVAVLDAMHGAVSVDDRPHAEPQGPWRVFILLILTHSLCTISAHAG